ncbi:MAG: ABC transporter permease [Anaerolineae bacterium]|nr:ABC transporter permease [Anaerolineae bacterium]
MSLVADTSVPASPSTWAGQLAESLRGVFLHRRWITFLVIGVVWQVTAMIANIGLFPTPATVIAVSWQYVITGLFFSELGISMIRIILGFSAALLLGTIVGILMGSWRFWDEFFQDFVILGLSMPALIYALLCVMVFGLGLTAPVMAIILGAYPFVAVNIREGVKSIDKELLDMSHVYAVDRWRLVRQLILPSLLPFILAAIRVGFTVAWKISVLTEVFGGDSGIGYQIRVDFASFKMRGVLAWGILFGMVMLTIEYGLLLPAERHFARWRAKVKEVI